jgi:PAS domain S-box-containing protein
MKTAKPEESPVPSSPPPTGLSTLGARLKELEDAERKFRGMIEAAQDAIVAVGTDGTIAFINRRVSDWFGYEPHELIGRPIEILMPERFRDHHVALRSGYAAQPSPRPMGAGLELFARRKNGSEFPVDIALSPSPNGHGVLITAVIRDVTEAKKREAERNRAIADREALLAIVSHDLKNPLTAIILSAQALRRAGRAGDGKRGELVARIERSAHQMKSLIADLLDSSKIQSGTFALKREPSRLNEIFSDVIEPIRTQAEAKRIALVVSIPDSLPLAECDRRRIGQALSNLLQNAVKFTPPGGRIELTAMEADTGISVSVSDTGPGIAPEHLLKVFDPYWQAEKTGTLGSGLGLSIAKGIVEAHGGTLAAENKPGQGARFCFTLPITK